MVHGSWLKAHASRLAWLKALSIIYYRYSILNTIKEFRFPPINAWCDIAATIMSNWSVLIFCAYGNDGVCCNRRQATLILKPSTCDCKFEIDQEFVNFVKNQCLWRPYGMRYEKSIKT